MSERSGSAVLRHPATSLSLLVLNDSVKCKTKLNSVTNILCDYVVYCGKDCKVYGFMTLYKCNYFYH